MTRCDGVMTSAEGEAAPGGKKKETTPVELMQFLLGLKI
jgi:hypothetical protein